MNTTWMDLDSIMLSEISQTEENKYRIISLLCGILKKKTNKQMQQYRNRNLDVKNKQVGARREAEMYSVGNMINNNVMSVF